LVWATVVLTLWSAWPYVRRTGLLWSDGKGSE
jgi:hypothetical protein